jgi:hypothetical protein
MGQRAREKIKIIKESHQPQTLSPDVDAAIESVLKRAKDRLGS